MARAAKKETVLTPEEKLAQALVPEEDQPYQIPENWCWVTTSTLASIISKGTTPQGGKSSYVDFGVNFLRVENIADDGTISHDGIMHVSEEMHTGFLKRSILQEGDILVSIAGTLGKTAIIRAVDLPMNTNQAVSFVRLKDCSISKQYIKYAFDNPAIQDLLLSKTKVTAIPNLTLEIISNCPIPLPPLAEQQRIVDRIESLFAKLDEAKEKAQAVVDRFEDRRTMILHDAFTGELTTNWRRTHNVSGDSWELLTLNDVAEYKKGPFGSSITKAMFVPKGEHTYKVYEQGNAIRKTLDYGHYYINEQKFNELKGFAVQAGDIIISCAGTIGEVYKLPEECEEGVINQALMRVRLHSNIEERFFSYYFGEVIKGDVIDQANGTAIKNIPPFKVMKAMEIRLPSLAEQEAIVDLLDEMLRKEEQAQETAERVIDQIDAMKKSILSRAFRGGLGTNNPMDEKSVELLKNLL